jgi:predicted Rossmann fold flavoprotein
MQFDVIVIGAGAAGMMCAAQAGQRGRRVLLIDHVAKIGERIRISGGGRCNFTNRNAGAENFLSQNPDFCRSALARFSTRDFIAMVDRRHIRYEEREHGQLFCLDSAQDIIDLLRNECVAGKVHWRAPCAVRVVEAVAEGSSRYCVVTDAGSFTGASVVVASGGLAAPKIGATPFAYRLAEQFGLDVIPPRPALVPLALAAEAFSALKPLAGISFRAAAGCDTVNAAARFIENILITHRGLSGPAILQISSYWQMQDYMPQHRKQPINIDLLPGLDVAAWLATNHSRKLFLHNLLAEHVPRRFAQGWCALNGFDKPLNELSSREIDLAVRALKKWTLMPSGTLGYNKAEVTLGGVDTDGLSSKTMEAKTSPGLYFIGECVDVTGWLGGYNFQWAWSSGWVAGHFA